MIEDHPAKWSASVLRSVTRVVRHEVTRVGRPLEVLDPFAGIGRVQLVDHLGELASEVTGVELQPEWIDPRPDRGATIQGDATDLPDWWGDSFDAVVTSPCYGNRMADHHDARDLCKPCGGTGTDQDRDLPDGDLGTCPACKGTGLSWRNTYAHALRRHGGELVAGSAAGMQWGPEYRLLHQVAMREMLRVTRTGGLLVVNMSNHVRDGAEVQVVEWWINELLLRGCSMVQVRFVPTRRQRLGANGDARVDGERLIVVRTPNPRRLL